MKRKESTTKNTSEETQIKKSGQACIHAGQSFFIIPVTDLKTFQTGVLRTVHTKMKQTDSTLPATQKSYVLLTVYFSVQHNTQEIHFFQSYFDCINSFKIGCLQNFVSQQKLQEV